MSRQSWTTGELAGVHQDLLQVGQTAAGIAAAWAGSSNPSGDDLSPSSPPIMAVGSAIRNRLSLRQSMREAWSALQGIRSDLLLPIVIPSLLLSFILVKSPMGLPDLSPVAVLISIVFVFYFSVVFWSALARARLQGLPTGPLTWGFYLSVDKQSFPVLKKLAIIAGCVYFLAGVGLLLVGALASVLWPVALLIALLAMLICAAGLFYSTSVIAGDGRSFAESMTLLRTPDVAIGVGLTVSTLPILISAAVTTVAFTAHSQFTIFNPIATVGMALLLAGFIPLSTFTVDAYRQLR